MRLFGGELCSALSLLKLITGWIPFHLLSSLGKAASKPALDELTLMKVEPGACDLGVPDGSGSGWVDT